MAKRPVTFKPSMTVPEGLNNYPGTTFRCFTVGDTLPFEFRFKDDTDGSIPDVADWVVQVAFAKELDSDSGINVTIPPVDIAEGIFYGEITDAETATLTPGINYGVAKYTNALGKTFIIDMCILEVYQNLDFTLAE